MERVQLYLASDQPVQQLAAVANLPGLVRAAGRGAWAAVSPGLAATVRQLDGEGQLLAAEALAKLAGERLLPAADVAESILPLALAGALGEGGAAQAAVQAAWLACLGDAAGAVEPATLHSRVLPALAQCGAGGGRSTHDRCLCCKLLGAVLPHAGAGELAGALLRLGSALCQDTEWQVRHAAAAQLPALAAAAAGVDGFALAAVLDDVFAMADDEEVRGHPLLGATVRARLLAACWLAQLLPAPAAALPQ